MQNLQLEIRSILHDKHSLTKDDSAKLAMLLNNPTLTAINFVGNNIEDAGALSLAEALKVNTTLTSINLGDNNIQAAGALSLADALKVNTTLTSINIRWNNMQAAGALSLADALKVNTTLTTIDLENNNIEDAGALGLTQALLINPCLLKLNGVDSPEIPKIIKRNHFYLSYRVDFLLIPEFFQKGVPTAENPDVENPFLLLPMEIRIKILRCCVPSFVTMQSIKRFADSPERLRFFQQKIEKRSQSNSNLEGSLQDDRDDQSCEKIIPQT